MVCFYLFFLNSSLFVLPVPTEISGKTLSVFSGLVYSVMKYHDLGVGCRLYLPIF